MVNEIIFPQTVLPLRVHFKNTQKPPSSVAPHQWLDREEIFIGHFNWQPSIFEFHNWLVCQHFLLLSICGCCKWISSHSPRSWRFEPAMAMRWVTCPVSSYQANITDFVVVVLISLWDSDRFFTSFGKSLTCLGFKLKTRPEVLPSRAHILKLEKPAGWGVHNGVLPFWAMRININILENRSLSEWGKPWIKNTRADFIYLKLAKLIHSDRKQIRVGLTPGEKGRAVMDWKGARKLLGVLEMFSILIVWVAQITLQRVHT